MVLLKPIYRSYPKVPIDSTKHFQKLSLKYAEVYGTNFVSKYSVFFAR